MHLMHSEPPPPEAEGARVKNTRKNAKQEIKSVKSTYPK